MSATKPKQLAVVGDERAMHYGGAESSVSSPRIGAAFLFSDIEGSTKRWERFPDAMQSALARHDELLRTAVESCGGRIFKTVGDGVCAAFGRTSAAALAAVAAELAMESENFLAVDGLRVRIAIHLGAAVERDGDYFGPALNRVARLLATGHGGQILLSQSATETLLGELPPGGELRDLGPHRLKDLANPERVAQLWAPGLQRDFPPLRSLGAFAHNLPREMTRFVGREAELRDIAELIERTPILSVVGSGGIGKTRCALHVGAEMLERFSDGVWFVELAPLSAPELVASAIAAALNVREVPGRPVLETLVAHLESRSALLVLDNCEHVVSEAAHVVATISQSCRNVQVLTTSREPLRIAGERVYRLPVLEVPTAEDTPSLDSMGAGGYAAIALFADRAAAADHRFVLSDRNAPIVADICRQLDGVALAIELAAARIGVLSVDVLSAELKDRLQLLGGGNRSTSPRQQTMRALFDWSYDLLGDAERLLFRRLAVFRGGCTLQLATAVCAEVGQTEYDVLDGMTSLVDKSLVSAEFHDIGMRYTLLESTRRYAHERLVETGECEEAARRHAWAFTEFAEKLESSWDSTAEAVWLSQSEPELENWRSALLWCFGKSGDATLGQRTIAALRSYWSYLAPSEGNRWVRAAFDAVTAATPAAVRAGLELADAQLLIVLSRHKAGLAAAERALEGYAAAPDHWRRADALRLAGRELVFLGRRDEAKKVLERALAAARELGARNLVGFILESMALNFERCGDFGQARRYYAESLQIHRETGHARSVATVTANLAEAEFRNGNVATALALAEEASALRRTLNHRRGLANTLSNIAAYLIALERFEEADERLKEALAVGREVRFSVQIAYVFQHYAAAAALRPRNDDGEKRVECLRAARLLGFVDARLLELETQREFTEEREYAKLRAALEASLTPEALTSASREGASWSEEFAVLQVSRELAVIA